jgi:hypothetical protein
MDRRQLESTAREIGQTIERGIDDRGTGYALLLFDFGEAGSIAYMSNASRPDMIKALEELLGNLKKNSSDGG